MKIYYAHSMHLYGKPQERRDIELLGALGFEVINPNTDFFIKQIKKISEHPAQTVTPEGRDSVSARIMDMFYRYIKDECNALAFRGHFDGSIGAGVWGEIQVAMSVGLPVIELPSLMPRRSMNIADTREALKLLGER